MLYAILEETNEEPLCQMKHVRTYRLVAPIFNADWQVEQIHVVINCNEVSIRTVVKPLSKYLENLASLL